MNCEQCSFFKGYDWHDGLPNCGYFGGYANCPYKKYIEISKLPNFEVKCSNGKDYVLLPFKHLSDIPTADVKEVKHGKWKVNVGMNYNRERICPICKKKIEGNHWNYCSNCGTNMDVTEEGVKHAHWKYWDGWCGNHDQRIEDAVCSNCGYKHQTIRLEKGEEWGSVPNKLAKECPKCHAKMDL